ncbi:hypothetical protein [Methylopila turkensis]|uniref:Uncharacterized protein n=1 Tax=Methylopila turkensis TaxID=1437816 RepID=A0A9W6N7C7_9HYPH|nr:hypothetical protein [Methylopila turkensis]GLK80398.1 hypothetical protein GCM10008174_21390 [Methylopila turkensis]
MLDTPDIVTLNDSAQILPSPSPKANVVVFGGLRSQGGYSIPAFEFVHTLRELSYNVLFVKDETRRWYNFGLKGFSDSMDDTSAKIGRVINERFGKNGLPLITLGNSMGGYAALYFGERLKAQYVLAIVPQTIISVEARTRLDDDRWRPELSGFRPQHADLRNVLRGGAVKSQIVVGRDCLPDIVQAGNLAGARGVHIDTVEGASHDVTRVWKDKGALVETISGYLDKNLPNVEAA